MSWVADKLHTLGLGNQRLSRRTVLLAERLAAQPMTSIPGGQGRAAAAYRLPGLSGSFPQNSTAALGRQETVAKNATYLARNYFRVLRHPSATD